MKVYGYVEFYDERASFGKWERCADFKYSDDAITFAQAAYAKDKSCSYKAYRCTDAANNGFDSVSWNSDTERDAVKSCA